MSSKIWSFSYFCENKIRRTKKVMTFLTGLCQDDVTTSNGDDILRNKLHNHVWEKISRDVIKTILQICHGSRVMQQKVGMGSFWPKVTGWRLNVSIYFPICWGMYQNDTGGLTLVSFCSPDFTGDRYHSMEMEKNLILLQYFQTPRKITTVRDNQ